MRVGAGRVNEISRYRPDNVNLNIIFVTIFLISIFSIQTISADVLSVNAGGSNNTAVTPDRYIEGFFTGLVTEEAGAVCGNSVVETGEQCDDGNTNSGDGCSATCQTEVPGGGGGAGGGGGPSAANLVVSPEEFNINLAIDTTTEGIINVTNTGGTFVTVTVSQSNLGSHVILENSTLTIAPGETVSLKVVFVALSEPGIFTGTINIGGSQVLVALNVKTRLLLFDSNIVVLNDDYKVEQGDELRTRVTLIPLGDPERLDVSLFFTIRDYAGNIYLTKSETLLVDRIIELNRNFDTGTLPIGQYVVGLELRYPNGVAPSSAHFDVIQGKGRIIIGKIMLFLISLILIVLILIILIILWRRRKKEEEGETG